MQLKSPCLSDKREAKSALLGKINSAKISCVQLIAAALLLSLFHVHLWVHLHTHFHAHHGTTTGFHCTDKHGVITANRANVVHCLVLSGALAGAYDRNGATATAFMCLTDRHQFDVRAVFCHMLQHDVLAFTASHRDRIARLQCFGLGLGRNVIHLHHVCTHLRVVFFICGVNANRPPCRERTRQYDSQCEGAYVSKTHFLFHVHNRFLLPKSGCL